MRKIERERERKSEMDSDRERERERVNWTERERQKNYNTYELYFQISLGVVLHFYSCDCRDRAYLGLQLPG